MSDLKIFTEEPEQELWRSLLQFSYRTNIKRYFVGHNIVIDQNDEDILTDSISGAFSQANEYFKACMTTSLQIGPLLLYYGTTNLLYAMSALIDGRLPSINNHGMKVEQADNIKSVADTTISFNSPNDGGVHYFAKRLGFTLFLGNYNPWKLIDFLDSIAEIKNDFNQCYQNNSSNILMLNLVKTPDGTVEKIYIEDDSTEQKILNIEGFRKSYLPPQKVQDKNKNTSLILRHKLIGEPIHQESYSGQPYLQAGHVKEGKIITIPRCLNMYISLYVLGNLCRYHPGVWNHFVTQDSSGEKLLVEKLLYYSRRIIPNIVLNRILGNSISFVSDKYIPENQVHMVSKHELQEMLSDEVYSQVKQEISKVIVHTRK